MHHSSLSHAKVLKRISRMLPGVLGLAAALFGMAAPLSAKTLDWDDGVNVQAGFFNGADKGNIPIGWDLMKKFDKIGTVRIEIPPDQDVRMATMQDWIRGALGNDCAVIVTYHRYQDNGSNDVEALLNAANWWKANFAALSEAGPFTVNLINEWGGHSITPEQYADAYNKAIAIVREVYSGPIIVDIPGWGQETVTAKDASSLIKDRNIVFSIHIYSSAYVEQGPHHWMQPKDLVDFSAVDRPVMIGEFGGTREGGADWAALTDQAKALGWTVIAWAWNGDGEGMNMVMPSWNDEHSPKAYYPSMYFAPIYARIGSTPDPQMLVSVRELIHLGPWAGSFTFAIHSNASWTVSSGSEWIECLTPQSGWGTQTVTFHVPENKDSANRVGSITVTCGDITRTFPVQQGCWAEHNRSEKERLAKLGK
ncbi:MAG: cellulase family glycosylhydrolase [Opitutales bacterium]|jgi:hypothetical protein